jgi:hypothetical protein
MSPEGDLAEDPAHRAGLVASAQVREGVGGIAGRVEAAVARKPRHRMRLLPFREGILILTAVGEHRGARFPDELVQDRAEP